MTLACRWYCEIAHLLSPWKYASKRSNALHGPFIFVLPFRLILIWWKHFHHFIIYYVYGLLHEQELKSVLCIFICVTIFHIFFVIRYESPYWRCLAASRIQVAYRYRRKRLSRANISQHHHSFRQWFYVNLQCS